MPLGLILASAVPFDCVGTEEAVVYTGYTIRVTKISATETKPGTVLSQMHGLPWYKSERRANTEQHIRQVLLPVDKQGRGREAGINPTIPGEA